MVIFASCYECLGRERLEISESCPLEKLLSILGRRKALPNQVCRKRDRDPSSTRDS